MRLRIIIEPDAPSCSTEPDIFRTVMLRRPSPVWPFLGSLAGHVVIAGGLVSLAQQLSFLREESRTDWSHYKMETIHLRLAEPVFYAPASAAAATANAGKTGSPGHRLPEAARWNKQAPVILQPDPIPQPAIPAALPNVALWARKAPDLPKPPLEQEPPIAGRPEAASPTPPPAARPVLAVPNREPLAADVNVAIPPSQSPQTTAAALPNSATIPIQLANATDQRTGSFDPFAGRPVNVIVLASDHGKARDIEVPKGLVNLPPGAGNDGGGDAAGAANSASGGQGTGQGKSPQGTANSGKPAAGTSNTSNSSAASAAADRARAASARQGGAVTPSLETLPPKAPPAPVNSEVTRIQHPPAGTFDVVLMQSGARDDLPELAGLLTGNPVYTVYLRVGDKKEWLLQYCEPAHETKQENPFQLTVDAPAVISPPYPISTVIPGSFTSLQRAGRIVLRGILKASGSLIVTRVSDTATALFSQLVSLVNQWQFRPALRNKLPIDVEVLLVIPPLL